jgi:2-haloacid dehalogenase
MQINTIIFDLGGVMIDWNPRYLYSKIFEDGAEMEYFLSEVCTSAWNHEQDAGRSLEEATHLLITQYPSYESQIRAFYGRWTEMLNGSISRSVIIQQLLIRDPRYKVVALTNWSAETWVWALDIFPFLHDFDGVLVSGQEKMAKPEHRIYELCLERFDIEADKSVFIDDSERNVIAAQELGIHGIHFRSAEQMEGELRAMGIL